jgi:ABC-type lipoprotein release transport system permease subunit
MQKILFKMALRNVLRRKLQTTLLGTMIIFTTIMLFVNVGFLTGASKMLESSYTKVFTGDIQIRSVKYEDVEDYAELVDTKDLAKIFEVLDNYKESDLHYTQRSISFGLADANDKNYSFQLIGSNPSQEKYTSLVASKMISGEYLAKDDTNKILIGKDLAEFLRLKVGDEVVLMTNDIYDSFVIDSFVVKGIYKIGDMQLDKGSAFINSSYFANNIVYDENKITNLTIKLEDTSKRDDLLKQLRKAGNPNIKILDWQEVLPSIKQTLDFQLLTSAIIYIIFVTLIAFTVLNSMMLATVKRIPEFGILSSIGLDNKYFKSLLWYENLILCGSAVIVGSIIGAYIVYYLGLIGVPLPMGAQENEPLTIIDRTLYPDITNPLLLFGPILVFVCCSLSIIPAIIKLNKSNPIQSLTSI